LRQLIAKVRKKELIDCKHGRSCVEKGYTKIAKKLPQNVVKKSQQMCTTVQLMEGGRFCACVCGVDEILSISARFVKHFGSASNI
jgi:hypothetical protein